MTNRVGRPARRSTARASCDQPLEQAATSLLTEGCTAEFGRSGNRVDAIPPELTWTEGTEFMRDALDQLALAAPAGRVVTPQEIANTALVPDTDAAASFKAQFPADGGRTAV